MTGANQGAPLNTETFVVRDIHNRFKSEGEKEYQHEEVIKNVPYTIFGSTPIHTKYSFALKVGGLRKILDDFDLHGDDSLFIEEDAIHGTKISFIRKGNSTDERMSGQTKQYKHERKTRNNNNQCRE